MAKEQLAKDSTHGRSHPERSGTGRPAAFTLDQIARTAIAVADRDGLDAVSMRRIGAELGTGASSLYRYVANRDELLDAMIDAAAEYEFAPVGDFPLDDLIALARRQREIYREHRWLPALIATRAPLGPHGAELLEHFLTILDGVLISPAAGLEAFAVFNALIAAFAQNENHDAAGARSRAIHEYLSALAADGDHPAIGRLVAETASTTTPPTADEQFDGLITRVLAGLLGLAPVPRT